MHNTTPDNYKKTQSLFACCDWREHKPKQGGKKEKEKKTVI